MQPSAPCPEAPSPPRKRGRPPKGADAKTGRIVVVVSPADRRWIQAGADSLGLTLSRFMVHCLEIALPRLKAAARNGGKPCNL